MFLCVDRGSQNPVATLAVSFLGPFQIMELGHGPASYF
jgi:hypothetical protein